MDTMVAIKNAFMMLLPRTDSIMRAPLEMRGTPVPLLEPVAYNLSGLARHRVRARRQPFDSRSRIMSRILSVGPSL